MIFDPLEADLLGWKAGSYWRTRDWRSTPSSGPAPAAPNMRAVPLPRHHSGASSSTADPARTADGSDRRPCAGVRAVQEHANSGAHYELAAAARLWAAWSGSVSLTAMIPSETRVERNLLGRPSSSTRAVRTPKRSAPVSIAILLA